jgi:hypothetical protein
MHTDDFTIQQPRHDPLYNGDPNIAMMDLNASNRRASLLMHTDEVGMQQPRHDPLYNGDPNIAMMDLNASNRRASLLMHTDEVAMHQPRRHQYVHEYEGMAMDLNASNRRASLLMHTDDFTIQQQQRHQYVHEYEGMAMDLNASNRRASMLINTDEFTIQQPMPHDRIHAHTPTIAMMDLNASSRKASLLMHTDEFTIQQPMQNHRIHAHTPTIAMMDSNASSRKSSMSMNTTGVINKNQHLSVGNKDAIKRLFIITPPYILNSIIYNNYLFESFNECTIVVVLSSTVPITVADSILLSGLQNVSSKITIYTTNVNNTVSIFKKYENDAQFLICTPQATIRPDSIDYIARNCVFSIYQTEQINTTARYNLHIANNFNYLTLFNNARRIYDYSIENITYLSGFRDVYFLPFYVSSLSMEQSNKDIDIFFCGAMNSRRQSIINALYNEFPQLNIQVATDFFGVKLTELVKRAKICLNLHYYSSPVLEIARIHEFLPYSVHVISESTTDKDIMHLYESSISFIPEITDSFDCTELISQIKRMLANPVSPHLLDNRKRLIKLNHEMHIDMFTNILSTNTPIDFMYPFKNITVTSTLEFNKKARQITDYKCDNADSFLLDDNITYTKQYNTKYSYAVVSSSMLNKIDNFILVVDFPNLGGGTSFFLDTIISKYSKNHTFIVVRKMSSSIRLYINNSYIVDTIYTDDNAYALIISKINSIHKVFFNHTLGHSSRFIQLLHTLPKHKSYITHDFYCLTDKYQPLVHDIINFTAIKPDLSMYDSIITQNVENLTLLQSGLPDKCNIVISTLPDYRYSGPIVETSNNKIVLGIIGVISHIKGYHIVRQLIETFKNTHVEVVVFGVINIPNFKSFYPYKNVYEFNSLLIKHKPNVLFEASLWPETYSYTLTLAMATQLPILYLYKPFNSVIKNRLSTYKSAFEYKNITEFRSLVYSKKQGFFYTVDPNIYYSSFWDNFFSAESSHLSLNDQSAGKNPPSTCKNIAIITSKIYVSTNPFSYVKNRSIFTPGERFCQTIRTITSLRQKIPDVFIILYDNSNFTQFEYYILDNLIDAFINITDDELTNRFTNIAEHKQYGEIVQTYKILEYIYTYLPVNTIENIFKISGRYTLNDMFTYKTYNNPHTCFKLNTDVTDRRYYFTCFYKIGKPDMTLYYDTICKLYADIQIGLHKSIDLEVLLPSYLYAVIKQINTLGVQQNIAVWQDTSNI